MVFTVKDLDEIEKVVDEQIEEKTCNLPTKDEFFTKMDEILAELKTIRESTDILTHHVSGHEERILKIEKKITSALSS